MSFPAPAAHGQNQIKESGGQPLVFGSVAESTLLQRQTGASTHVLQGVTVASIAVPASYTPASGSGSPEGVVTRSVGTTYLDTSVDPPSLWIKFSGSGNTGWRQLIAVLMLLFSIFGVSGQPILRNVATTNTIPYRHVLTNGVIVGVVSNVDWVSGVTGYVSGASARMGVNVAAGSSTNALVQTNGVNVGDIGTLNFIGATGAVISGVATIGGFGGSSGLTTNANQFLGVPLSLIDNVQLTNEQNWGNSFVRSNSSTVRTNMVAIQIITNEYYIGSPASGGHFMYAYDLAAGAYRNILQGGAATLTWGTNEHNHQWMGIYFRPVNDNTTVFGGTANRWKEGWFGNYLAVSNLFRAGFLSLSNIPGLVEPYFEIRSTNGTGYDRFGRVDANWKPTNNWRLSTTNPVVGQVLKFASVTYSGGEATIVLTNDTDNTGGAGSSVFNINQFSASSTHTNIKESALLTNTIFYSSDTNRTNITIQQAIGQAVPMFSVRGSNNAPIVEFDNRGFLVMTNSLTNYNNSGTKTPPTNTLIQGVTDLAGRLLPAWTGQMGLQDNAQPFLGNNRVILISPAGLTAPSQIGDSINTLGGTTISHPDMETVNWILPYMSKYAAPASDKGVSGFFTSHKVIPYRRLDGNQRMSGFFAGWEWAITNLEAQRFITTNITYIGMVSTNSPNYTNIVITTNGAASHLGFYVDARTSTNIYISSQDTAQFRTNTGIIFVASNLYQCFLFNAPTSRFVSWLCRDLTARTEASGWFSNNVPTNGMLVGMATRNGTNRAHDFFCGKLYIEAPLAPQ